MSDLVIHPDDIGTPDVSIKVNVAGGTDGATFTPAVSEEGVLSWSNNAGLENPEPVDIKGPKGDPGKNGSLNLVDGAAVGSVRSVGAAEETDDYKLGRCAVAFGDNTKASGYAAHAEGTASDAQGAHAHAEGLYTSAVGDDSHAEGFSTVANGRGSHAEGIANVVSGEAAHVQGKYSKSGARSQYAHIVGNGESDSARSNAHTLDWQGNAWFAGDVIVGGASQDDESAKVLATQKYVDDKFGEIEIPEAPSLEGYATETYVDDKIANIDIPSTEGLATETYVDNKVNAIKIPAALPNPNVLTFTGAASGTYDGSEAVTINIPQGGGVSSWNDLTDKPFGEEMGDVYNLPETTLAIDTESGEGILTEPLAVALVVGNTYTVAWNGTEYNCTAQAFDLDGIPTIALGDLGAMSGGDSTGEPFVLLAVPDEVAAQLGAYGALYALDGSASVTLSIKHVAETIKTLDNKYLDFAWFPTEMGDVETEFIPEIMTSDTGSANLSSSEYDASMLTEGGKAAIYVDGVRCEATVKASNGTFYVGNFALLQSGTLDTGENFVALFMEENATISVTPKAEHTFSMYVFAHGPNKLPYSFIPHNVATKKHVDDKISAFVTAAEVDKKIAEIVIPSVEGLASEAYVDDKINEIAIPSIDGLASETYVDDKVAGLVSSAPETLDTLNELSAALGNNPNFATTIAEQIGKKADASIVPTNIKNGSAEGSLRTINAATETADYKLGTDAFAEGHFTKAPGQSAHAEGMATEASGIASHAEGISTITSGDRGSHAEGYATISAGHAQHTQGMYNVKDDGNKYAHIVGNGSASDARSNAHTLDWDGNAWFAGTIYLGGTGQDDTAAVNLDDHINSMIDAKIAAIPNAEEASF